MYVPVISSMSSKHFFPLFLFLGLFISCTNNSTEEEEEEEENFVIWEGASLEFTKESEADPTLRNNQDSISPSVRITRGVDGGQIYNVISEDASDKDSSPLGTRWAEGAVEDIAELSFSPFRTAVVNPKQVVGKKLILHLVNEDVYVPIEFSSWEDGKGGGFSYTRATE